VFSLALDDLSLLSSTHNISFVVLTCNYLFVSLPIDDKDDDDSNCYLLSFNTRLSLILVIFAGISLVLQLDIHWFIHLVLHCKELTKTTHTGVNNWANLQQALEISGC